MNTRRYPRTLEQAFGPHTSRHITEPDEPMPTADKIVVAASLIAAAALIGMILIGWV